MKARIKKIETLKEFKPFTLEIDVHNVDEAGVLWHLFNISIYELAESVRPNNSLNKKLNEEIFEELGGDLFNLVDRELIRQGCK